MQGEVKVQLPRSSIRACPVCLSELKPPETSGGETVYNCPSCEQNFTEENVAAPQLPKTANPRKNGFASPLPLERVKPVTLVAPVDANAASQVEVSMPASKFLQNILEVARRIRTKQTQVGCFAFVCFAIHKSLRVYHWLGTSCIDLVKKYAPFHTSESLTECNVHAVVCHLKSNAAGSPEFVPASETHPLREGMHFMAAQAIPALYDGVPGIHSFYQKQGVILLPTVIDGDNGMDVICQMNGVTANKPFHREKLRMEIHDFVVRNSEEPWLHELMVATGEASREDLDLFRHAAVAADDVETPNAIAPYIGEHDAVEQAISPELIEAIGWRTKTNDQGFIISLARSLPEAVRVEQIELWKNRVIPAVKPSQCGAPKLLVNQRLVCSRMQAASRFHKYLLKMGWDDNMKRLPAATTQFHV